MSKIMNSLLIDASSVEYVGP